MDKDFVLRINQIGRLVLEIETYIKPEELEHWRVRTSGPYWSHLRRFCKLLDVVKDLLLLVEKVEGDKDECGCYPG